MMRVANPSSGASRHLLPQGEKGREHAIANQPSPLAGEGGTRSVTDEGAVATRCAAQISPLASPPSSAPSGHLLPRGEKEGKVAFARHLRRNMTDVEVKLWNALRGRRFEQFKFRRQVPVGKYIADFVCFEKKLIVELDGSQHQDSRHDEIRDAWLKSQNFRILRFWNIDINQALDGSLLAILDALK